MPNDPNPKPHPMNAPGPVFSNCNECIDCGACLVEAPDLMGVSNDTNGCFFRKQPQSEAEWHRAARASRVSCVGAICCSDPMASVNATGKTWNKLGLEFMNSPRPAIPESFCEKCSLPKFAIEGSLICLHCETGFDVGTVKAIISLSPQPQQFEADALSPSSSEIVQLAIKTWIQIKKIMSRILTTINKWRE